MIVWAVLITQNSPYVSEHINSVHATEESAELRVEELTLDLPPQFSIDVEPMEVENIQEM